MSVELRDLVGEHVLTGVSFGKGPRAKYDYEDPNTMTFVLDGLAYRITEDPEDGYRSSMREIAVVNDLVYNMFPPVKVIGRFRDRSGYQRDQVLELIDAANGEVILEAGTCNTDDYYPYFVAVFYPDKMAINEAKHA